jgi:hypothetical protein
MVMLKEHLPLSLLVDLSAPDGPNSQRILDEEGSAEESERDEA